MSGGSMDYLYLKFETEEATPGLCGRAASALRERTLTPAQNVLYGWLATWATGESLVPAPLLPSLVEALRAVEWRFSNDIGDEEADASIDVFLRAAKGLPEEGGLLDPVAYWEGRARHAESQLTRINRILEESCP